MNCNNCGAVLDPSLTYCGFCGAANPYAHSGNSQQQYNYQNTGYNTYSQAPNYQYQNNTEFDPFTNYNTQQTYTYTPPQPMKWHNFLVKFCLPVGIVLNFLGAIGNIISLFTVATGFRGLMSFVTNIILCVFAFYIRSRLAGFYRNGPTLLYAYFGLSIILSIISNIFAPGMGAISPLTNIISTLLGNGILIACNMVYYNKRKDFFNK